MGKSTFLNYIAQFDEGDECHFEKGDNPGEGVTRATVAKRLKFRGYPHLEFIGVDTPGLRYRALL